MDITYQNIIEGVSALIVENLIREDIGTYVWCRKGQPESILKLVYDGILARGSVAPYYHFFEDWEDLAKRPEIVEALDKIYCLNRA